MVLGVSLSPDWLRGVVIKNGQTIFRTQLLAPVDYRLIVESISQMLLRIKNTYGSLSTVGICSLYGSSLPCTSEKISKFNIEDEITKKTAIPCKMFSPAFVILSNSCEDMLSELNGVIMSAVVDYCCDLCIAHKNEPYENFYNTNNLVWSQRNLYHQELIDEFLPECEHCGRRCVQHFIPISSIQRHYSHRSGLNKNFLEVFQLVAHGDNTSLTLYRVWIDQLARSLYEPILFFKPKILILSGLATIPLDFLYNLKSRLSYYLKNNEVPDIVASHHDDYLFAHYTALASHKKTKQPSTIQW